MNEEQEVAVSGNAIDSKKIFERRQHRADHQEPECERRRVAGRSHALEPGGPLVIVCIRVGKANTAAEATRKTAREMPMRKERGR